MINLSQVITNPAFCTTFIVYRKTGKFIKGRFQETEVAIHFKGIITTCKGRDLEQIPEGDRVGGERNILTLQPIYVTRDLENNKGTSDEILWHGERYKLRIVNDDSDYGFYKGIAQKISGK